MSIAGVKKGLKFMDYCNKHTNVRISAVVGCGTFESANIAVAMAAVSDGDECDDELLSFMFCVLFSQLLSCFGYKYFSFFIVLFYIYLISIF